MSFHDFVQLLRMRLPVGLVVDNPGGGTSTVLSHTEARIYYQRGDSPFHMQYCDIYDVYQRFLGQAVTTSDLKDYAPAIFEQAHGGHNCHRTFVLMVLVQMGIAESIWGAGVPGSPFGVDIPPLRPTSAAGTVASLLELAGLPDFPANAVGIPITLNELAGQVVQVLEGGKKFRFRVSATGEIKTFNTAFIVQKLRQQV